MVMLMMIKMVCRLLGVFCRPAKRTQPETSRLLSHLTKMVTMPTVISKTKVIFCSVWLVMIPMTKHGLLQVSYLD